MKYFTFHVNDSGAIEDIDYKYIHGEKVAVCKMYNDPDFNTLNDILHSTGEFLVNERALNILKGSKLIPHNLQDAQVLRKEKVLGIFKIFKAYKYYELSFSDADTTQCYEWIDFHKSEIFAIDYSGKKNKIYSHKEKLDFIEINKSNSDEKYSFETIKIVFGKNFNPEIDFFAIPYYSWGYYISDRLRTQLLSAHITDIGFAENTEPLGEVWKPHFPKIEFD